jgi:serine/threonine protein kinase
MRAVQIFEPIQTRRLWATPPANRLNAIAEPVDGGPRDVMGVLLPDNELTRPFCRADESLELVPPPAAVAADSRRSGDSFARPARIGKYELEDMIGQGSFGLVYTARDTELDRVVALKVLNPSHHGNGDALHRFLQEARAAARIDHAGIVTVLDCGRFAASGEDELAYIAMERLHGESLAVRIAREGKLEPAVAIEIARQVASALDAAHRANVLHRDLKPDNIFLVPDPVAASGERVKVLDFGLAKIGFDGRTQTNIVFGTPLYMSPEQCRSSRDIDLRSDIYALGCILFELVVGEAPFEGELYKVLERQQGELAPRVRWLAPEVPQALDDLIAEMLEKDPAARPPTMAAVERALQLLVRPLASPGIDDDAPTYVDDEDGVLAGQCPELDAGPPPCPMYLDTSVLTELPIEASYPARPRRRDQRRIATEPVWQAPARGPLAALAALTVAVSLAAILSLVAAHRHQAEPLVPAVPASMR